MAGCYVGVAGCHFRSSSAIWRGRSDAVKQLSQAPVCLKCMTTYLLLLLSYIVLSYLVGRQCFVAGEESGYKRAERDARWLYGNSTTYHDVPVQTSPPTTFNQVEYDATDYDGYETIITEEMREEVIQFKKDNPNATFGDWHSAYKSIAE